MAKRGSYNPGPLTESGRQASSKNAIVHGGRSERHRLLPGEREEDFQAIVDKWNNDFEPYTEVESGYVQTIAEREWMVLRCERNVERALFALMSETPNPLEWTKEHQNSLTLMQRYLTTAQRQMNDNIKAFHDLRKNRVAQKNLEERTKLKIAEVAHKLDYAEKVHELAKAKADTVRIELLRSKNVDEWDLLVLRAKEAAEAQEKDGKLA